MAPLYQQIYDQLRRRIESSHYPRGSALPAESRLVEEFGVSLITVRRALHELALDGLVESRQGVGHFVRLPAAQPVVIGLSTFTSDVVANRLRIVRSLLVDDLVQATQEIAGKLGVQAGSVLRHLVRLDAENHVPMSVDEVFVQPALAQKITKEIAAAPDFMHAWQLATAISLRSTQYEISVEMPSEQDIRYLHITADVPILVTGEIPSDSEGNPMMYLVTRYRGDRCLLSGTVTLTQHDLNEMTVGE